MPTTVSGLFVFVTLLIPGTLHYIQRRNRTPTQNKLSPFVETSTVVAVSIAANAVVLLGFGAVRSLFPHHTPDVRRLVLEGSAYAGERLGYLFAWGIGMLAFSSALAFVFAERPGFLLPVSRLLTPAIVDVSAWYHVFEKGPPDAYVYVGCDLNDGSYVGGVLEWYSTEVDETADRDFVLASPITYRSSKATEHQAIAGFSRLVLSARNVARLYVSYVTELPAPVARPENRA